MRVTSAFAITILKEVGDDMRREGAKDYLPGDFNHSRLISLPKKPSGSHADLGEYYSREAKRPLSIVNTDNRLLTAAANIILHDP